jgi:hypothetical protein
LKYELSTVGVSSNVIYFPVDDLSYGVIDPNGKEKRLGKVDASKSPERFPDMNE